MIMKTMLIAVVLVVTPAMAAANADSGKAKGAAKGKAATTGVLPDDRVLAKEHPASDVSAKSAGAPDGKSKGVAPK